MSWEEFIKKWANRHLYETFGRIETAGKIEMYKIDDYKLNHIKIYRVEAYVFLLPNHIGWRDEKQKKEFEKDAKKVGLTRRKDKKLEWYKVIQLHDLD